jgi:hypothetical protein
MGVSKFLQLRFPRLWGPITLCVDLRLRWGSKQSCSLCQEFFNGMSHATYTQGNWSDSWLLVVGSQIANLIPDPYFGYNLCVKCPNGSCKPILDIYVLRAFQWYKELLNLMGFDPCIRSLKIRESTGIPIPKMGVHLGVWRFIPSQSLTLSEAWNVTFRLPFWPAPSQALALVTSPKLRSWHKKYWN